MFRPASNEPGSIVRRYTSTAARAGSGRLLKTRVWLSSVCSNHWGYMSDRSYRDCNLGSLESDANGSEWLGKSFWNFDFVEIILKKYVKRVFSLLIYLCYP